jgi:histidinol-phosphatase (PHP family)
MSLPADYHMHTWLCRHAVGEPVEYAARAQALGMKEIAFTDHSPMPKFFDNWRMLFEDLGTYVEKVREAQRQFPNLVIRLAMEVDYFPGGEDWIRELTVMYPWDFLIGSVHYVSDTWAIDDPKDVHQWKGRDPYEVWEAYFERLAMAARSGLFEVIGHADLPKKFGVYPGRDCTVIFERFLEVARKSGVALDVNTAGLRKDCKEIYPSRQFMALAAARRVPITFGSDAHAPEEVGMAFDQAVRMVRELGYTHYSRFAGRQRLESPIEA